MKDLSKLQKAMLLMYAALAVMSFIYALVLLDGNSWFNIDGSGDLTHYNTGRESSHYHLSGGLGIGNIGGVIGSAMVFCTSLFLIHSTLFKSDK